MAEHHELIAEMPVLEQMGTQERQKLAKKRRLQQLKKWGQREKEWIAKEKQLNKRLANILQEENNGLNLKLYTTYSSSHRSKKKLQLTAPSLITSSQTNGAKHRSSIATSNEILLNNNVLTSLDDPTRLTPNGRVQFNVGVMLLEAAARNDFEEVKRLLMLGVSPDSVNHDGLTALHQCCIDASESMMNLLLEFGANVDATDTEQWTPLHAACTCGHLNLVKILIDNGANLLAVNGDGNMPFDICEDEATLDYIESQMLKQGITQEMIDYTRASTELQMISDLEKQVAHGRDLNASNDNGVTQLHVAAANGYQSAVEFLLKQGVNVNVCDNDQWRPLHGVACWGNEQHVRIVELLVEAGANLGAKTINDETVFDLCDNVELLEKLNQLKDDLESKQASGTDRLRRTPSRTNSRIHSVRRTSVRDKNQISRREAREEALLRVENSPTNGHSTIPNGKVDSDQTLPLKDEGLDSQRYREASHERSSSGDLNSNHKIRDELIHTNNNNNQPSKTNVSNKLADTGTQKFNSDKSITPSRFETDLDNAGSNSIRHDNLSFDKSRRHSQGTSESGSQSSSDNSISNGRPKRPVKHTQSSSISSNELTSSNTAKLNCPDNQVHRELLAHNCSIHKNGLLGSNKLVNGKLLTKNQESRDELARSIADDETDSAQDAEGNSNMLSAQSMTQLTPINYTLSNLKKQRSDLRMRTTSIGGGSLNAMSTGNLDADENNLSVSLGANGTQLQPESPCTTFRKFRGEPSEEVGGSGQRAVYKCCILI